MSDHALPTPAGWPGSIAHARVADRPDERSHIPIEPPLATLGEMVAALGRYIRPLVVWVALWAAAAGWYLHVTPPEYSAAATVILEPRRQTGALQDGIAGGYPPTLDSAQAESQIQVIKSERILAFVFDLLDLKDAPEFVNHGPSIKDRVLSILRLTSQRSEDVPDPAAEARAQAFQAFSDRVGVRRIGQSYVLEVSYRASTPGQAARIANAVTSAYVRSQVDLKAAAAQHGTEYLQGRIADIKAEEEAALDGVRQGRIPDVQFPDSDARVIGAALRPLGKSFPQSGLVIAFGVMFGLLTGLLAVAIRHALDRTLKTRQQIRDALGMDCLGVIPDAARMRDMRAARQFTALGRAVITQPDSRFAYAVRAARTAILQSVPPGRCRAIGIVSWSPGEGRTTVAANLAHLMSMSGDAVELVDGDLRNPALTTALAPNASSGLNESLLDHTGGTWLQPILLSDSLNFVPAVGAGHSSEPNLYLGSAEMQALLSGLRADHDVVFDLPPLGTSSDAQALSPFLDGVVLVVEASRTTAEEASEAIRVLRAANARVLGVVINKTRPERGRKPTRRTRAR